MDEERALLTGASARPDDRVLDTGALRALAHPMRIRIYDILSQYGAQTASTLAALLDESTGATSYHLRALAKHDLIREVEGRGSARERWWERPVGGVSFANPEAVKTPSGREATRLVMSEFFQLRHEQLMRFVGTELDNDTSAWREGSMISTATTRLTPAQSAELGAKIMELIDAAVDEHRTQTGDDVRPVSIRTDIFPLPSLEE